MPSLSIFLKNHRAILENTPITNIKKMAKATPIFNNTAEASAPFTIEVMNDKKSSAAVSVTMVPPTVTVTASFLVTPNLETIGYEISVCVVYMEAIKRADSHEKCNI